MSDYYGMAEVLESLESELAQVMTMQRDPRPIPSPYPCIIGARVDTQDLGAGGWAPGSTVEVVLRRAMFDEETLPTNNDNVTLNYRLHKINSVTISPDGSCVVLACEDVNKDA